MAEGYCARKRHVLSGAEDKDKDKDKVQKHGPAVRPAKARASGAEGSP